MKLFELLIESRIDYLKDKYIPLILDKILDNLSKIEKRVGTSYEDIRNDKTFRANATIFWTYLVKMDPTPNKKYLQWLLNNTLELDYNHFKVIVEEDGYKWKEYLSIYDKVKQRLPLEQRDINKLSLDQLKNIALEYKQKEEEILTKNDYLDKKYKINENNQYLVYMFKTATEQDFKMYQLVSTNTEWCTRPNYKTFKEYISKSPLFVFINKQNRNLKYQFHEQSNQFMDSDDKPVDHKLKIKLIPLIKNYLPEDFVLRNIIDNSYGFINTNGKIIAKGFKYAWSFSEGFACVQFNDNSWGFINKDGKIVAKGFKYAGSFNEGFVGVKFNDNSYGYISKDLKLYAKDKKTLIPNNDPRRKGIELFPENL